MALNSLSRNLEIDICSADHLSLEFSSYTLDYQETGIYSLASLKISNSCSKCKFTKQFTDKTVVITDDKFKLETWLSQLTLRLDSDCSFGSDLDILVNFK